MGKLSSEYYLRFLHRRRFYRWAYASFTFFAIFAVVMAFFNVSKHTDSSNAIATKTNNTETEPSQDELLLRWIYVFYPSPMLFAWIVVYTGRLLGCLGVRRLWTARSYKYNLLIASLVVAALYVVSIKAAIGMSFNSGPKMNSAIITAACVFGLIVVDVVDQCKARKQRRRGNHTLRVSLQGRVEGVSCSPEGREQQLSSSAAAHGPGGLV